MWGGGAKRGHEMNLELRLLGRAKEFAGKPLQGFEEAGFPGFKRMALSGYTDSGL